MKSMITSLRKHDLGRLSETPEETWVSGRVAPFVAPACVCEQHGMESERDGSLPLIDHRHQQTHKWINGAMSYIRRRNSENGMWLCTLHSFLASTAIAERPDKLTDPILKAIQSAIVSICVSDPTTGAMLGRLKLQPSVGIRIASKVDRDVLLYSQDHVKSLTMAELKKALANCVEKKPVSLPPKKTIDTLNIVPYSFFS